MNYYFERQKMNEQKTTPSITKLLVYQGKALNVPTAPYSVSIRFSGKQKLKKYKFWTISIKCMKI